MDVGTASTFMKYLIEKDIEHQAALLRATKSERMGEAAPTAASIDAGLSQDGAEGSSSS
jgi:hypothetical protein